MREYGGYIEFEYYNGREFHPNSLALNSGRNCLAHLIDVRNIKKVYLPYLICDSVIHTCIKKGVEIEFYRIDRDFKPIFHNKVCNNEYLYIVNYYGMLNEDYIQQLKSLSKNIILDNAQAFFNKAIPGIDTIYVARKFFGVPDGAYLATDCCENRTYNTDISAERMKHLLGRFEETGSKFYMDYRKNEELFSEEPVKYMSKLTHNLLRGIDYQKVRKIRNDNYEFLIKNLNERNLIKPTVIDGAFAYPFLADNGSALRELMHQNNIYIPQLWPDVLERCDKDSVEYYYAQNILPIPVDQRYNVEDMEYIVQVLIENQKME